MLDKFALDNLLGLSIPENLTEVIIYSNITSQRLNYACEFIFNNVLKANYKITENLTDLNELKGFKINYSEHDILGIFQIKPDILLSEKGITNTKPLLRIEYEKLYLFFTQKDNIQFDIFSAVFYMISRYEEWLPYEADIHGRFEAKASILYQNKFHLKPVVDIWIKDLSEALKSFYPTLKFPEKKLKIISTIDVDNLFAYKSKGVARTIGASLKDILKLDFQNLKLRLSVISGKQKDPFDIYEDVSKFCSNNQIPLIYFFLFKSGTKFDRTVNPQSSAYKGVFKTLKTNQALIGLHPSYNSSLKKVMLEAEVKLFSSKTTEPVILSRQHYLRFSIRTTPQVLMEAGIFADFSMGFASSAGFRAGTSHPFYYYDFNKEAVSNLLFVPFCFMDGVFTVYEKINSDLALKTMMNLADEVKKVDGFFISIFHERTFSDHLYKGFGTLYKNLHLRLNEL